MCDTLVIPAGSLGAPCTLFAKNSDREPNEAHQVITRPAADHVPGAPLACTWITIPQVAHTHAVLLCKPSWIWGAEMGANEHGVTIGNEAVFTNARANKPDAPRNDGLIGMDLLRLGLERATTAHEALLVMTDLLATYGQEGNCGFTRDFRYDNSFLIADPREAWLLETADRAWVAKRLTEPCAISNALTLTSDWDIASSPDFGSAGSNGGADTRINFAATFTDTAHPAQSSGTQRCQRTHALLAASASATVQALMIMLRDHGATADAAWRPDSARERTVCMHTGSDANAISQTTGSMVSWLQPAGALHFVTGTAAPCTGLFKPVWVDCALPAPVLTPQPVWDDETLFWQHEGLHRAILQDYPTRVATMRAQRDLLEAEFVERAMQLAEAPLVERQAYSEACIARHQMAITEWTNDVRALPIRAAGAQEYAATWQHLTTVAKAEPHNHYDTTSARF